MKNNNNVKAVLLVAPWCDSSYKIKPMFYDTCRNLGMRFEVLDVEEKDGLNLSIKYTVRNVPTILFINNKGREIGRSKGLNACLDIVNYVKQAIIFNKSLTISNKSSTFVQLKVVYIQVVKASRL